MDKPRLLLHICCAPCSSYVLELLQEQFDVTGYFYGPNIHPEEEYCRRLSQMQKLAARISLPLLEAPYEKESWFEQTRGLEMEPEGGKRCSLCYAMRLEGTAKYARKKNFQFFATVLTVSPHKKAPIINQLGRDLGREYGITFYVADFKKKDGFKKSLERAKHYGLYRQDYCGCLYSLKERQRRCYCYDFDLTRMKENENM